MGLICKQCYRSEPEIKVKTNTAGNITEICETCNTIIGKGPGYGGGIYSDEEANKWFEGIEDRKKIYEEQFKFKQANLIENIDAEKYLDKFKKEIIEVDIKKLSVNSWNPNRHSEQSFQTIKGSIKKFGFNDPVSVRQVVADVDDYEIIDGEHRWKACKELGFTRIIVINFGEVSKEEAMTLTQLLNHKGDRADILLKAKLLKELKSQNSLFDLLPGSLKDKDETIKLLEFDFAQFDVPEATEEEKQKDDLKLALRKAIELEVILTRIHDSSSNSPLRLAIEQYYTFAKMLKDYLK